MSTTASDYSAYFLLALLVALFVLKRRQSSKLPYPPGPKGLPLIGNVRDMPTNQEWLTYARWAQDLNTDIVHLRLVGTNMLVVNSFAAASELFEKRSAIYSDRPRFPMIVELMKCDWVLAFFHYGKQWREYRKMLHQHFNMNAVTKYEPQDVKAAHEFLQRLATTPEEFLNHTKLMAGSLILNVVHGIDIQSFEDPHLINAEKTLNALSEAGNQGSFLVDSIPILKYIPEWMPGAGFKTKARIWRQYGKDTLNLPSQHVHSEMEKGTHKPSISSQCYEDLKNRGEADNGAEEIIRAVTAQAYIAGADTTVSVIHTFFLAISMHPEVIKKAQEEIDELLGGVRLPEFSDRPFLPYVNAVVQESLRWHPVAPLSIPHRLMEDDEYNGMFMPKGSVVVGNAWAMLHDEKVYGSDVAAFNPERFLKDGVTNPDIPPADVAFGFGRRICPGRHLALDSIFIAVASVLATFEVSAAVDENGKVIVPSTVYTSGLVSHPPPFKAVIKPRSEAALSLVKEAYANYHN